VLEAEIDESVSAALVWDCARHWQAAGSTENVLRLATSKATHLRELGLPVQAAKVCAQAFEYCTNVAERQILIRHQCYALRAAGEWTQLVKALDHLAVRQETADVLQCHDDDEIMDYYARYRAGGDVKTALKRAMECAKETTASASHRLEAACIAFTLAFHCADEDAFQSAVKSVETILDHPRAEPRLRERAKMMYFTLAGRFSEAVDASRLLIGLERQDGNEVRLALTLSQAWNAFFEAGLLREAEQALLEAHDIRRRCQGPLSISLSCAVLLQHFARSPEMAATRTAERWYEEAEKWRRLGDDCFFSLAINYQGAQLSLRRNDTVEARRRLGVTIEELLSDTALQRRIQGIATWIRIELCEHRLPALAVVHRLRDDVKRSYWTGACDFEVQTLRLALVALGAPSEAEELREEYLSCRRRGSSPIAAELLAPLDAH